MLRLLSAGWGQKGDLLEVKRKQFGHRIRKACF